MSDKLIEFLDTETDGYDCDCCGWITNYSTVVVIGGEQYDYFHDGHFGGGEWDGSDQGLYLLVIKDLLDVHYVNYDGWSVGVRYDLSDVYGFEAVEKIKQIEPDRTCDITVADDFSTVDIAWEGHRLSFPITANHYNEWDEDPDSDLLARDVLISIADQLGYTIYF